MTNSAFHTLDRGAAASLQFGRFRVLLRQRRLLADGVPIELGTRAFELLLALLESNGSLVTKEQLLARVWPSIVVAEDNLKVQIFKLRRALGEDRDFIRTEFGRGYRFTPAVQSTVSARCDGALGLPKGSFRNRSLGHPRVAGPFEIALARLGSLRWRPAGCSPSVLTGRSFSAFESKQLGTEKSDESAHQQVRCRMAGPHRPVAFRQ